MKNLSLITAFLFFTVWCQAQSAFPKFTMYADGGFSVPVGESYSLDSYALAGPRFNLGGDFNFKSGVTIGLSYSMAVHSYDATLAANDLLEQNSLFYDLTPLSAIVEATPYQQGSFLINLGYKKMLNDKFGLDGKFGFGINGFVTPEVEYAVVYNDPSGLNQKQIGAIESVAGAGTMMNFDLGLNYHVSQKWGVRIGLGYGITTMDYDAGVYITEFDDDEIYTAASATVNDVIEASWLNASIGLTYSFGKRAQE